MQSGNQDRQEQEAGSPLVWQARFWIAPGTTKLKGIREPEAGESHTFGWATGINGAAAVTWAAMWTPSINRFVQFPYVQQFAAQRALAAFSFIRHRRFIRHRHVAAVRVARGSAPRSGGYQ